MSDVKSLTTVEVARLCRVSEATVKRWESAGILKSERTNGGHRRFRSDEVARFQREQGLGVKQKHGDVSALRVSAKKALPGNLSESSFFHSLVSGNEEEATNFLIKAYLHGEPLAKIFDEMLSTAMQRIGELWCEDTLSVAQEHLATRTAIVALSVLRNSIKVPESNNLLAICCGVEEDFHELPIHISQLILESTGWEVFNFGANTPFYSLTEATKQYSPALVCISAKILPNSDRAAREYRDFAVHAINNDVAVVLGGDGFKDGRIKSRFHADIFANNFQDLTAFAQQISAERKNTI